MKLVVVAALALVAYVAAAPADTVKEPVKIIDQTFEQQPEGQYKFNYETADGIKKEEVGEKRSLTNEKNEPVDVIVVRGSYTYTDPEGHTHTVTYTADETGFHSDNEPKA